MATARRVLVQTGGDPAGVVLVLCVPCGLLALLRALFGRVPGVFDRVGPQLFGVFPLIVMFMAASIVMVRERAGGTLERLGCLPLRRVELLVGYLLGFGVLAVLQAGVTAVLAAGVLGMPVAAPVVVLGATAALNAVLGAAMGLLVSTFARTEFQAVEYLPALLLPQFLLCGLFVPHPQMPAALQTVSDLLPMTYAVEATARLATRPAAPGAYFTDITVVSGFLVLAIAIGAVTLRHRTCDSTGPAQGLRRWQPRSGALHLFAFTVVREGRNRPRATRGAAGAAPGGVLHPRWCTGAGPGPWMRPVLPSAPVPP
ncbi:ABC transporter permease [Streptomyces sp. NPDC059003]|uniref:ABC transporter permease n=1 Tax=Streptomyces sp. NPDC059003 TaxID=3346691 RepID=UPI0036C41815